MGFVVYGVGSTRIVLNSGGIPAFRITLQKESTEGLVLSFKPEGAAGQLGSGAAWAKTWAHHGFRPTLAIKWGVGIKSTIETYSGGSYGAPTQILTADALTRILSYGFKEPMLVQPHLDNAFSFLAQPDPGVALNLKDNKGAYHTSLETTLIGTTVADLPAWS